VEGRGCRKGRLTDPVVFQNKPGIIKDSSCYFEPSAINETGGGREKVPRGILDKLPMRVFTSPQKKERKVDFAVKEKVPLAGARDVNTISRPTLLVEKNGKIERQVVSLTTESGGRNS